MKKILLILVLTLAAALPSQARKANINRSGDTTTIVMNGDTVRITDGEVKKTISKAINDTLWSEKAETADDDETYNYMALDNDARLKEASMWSSTVKQISISMCFCIIVVVFLSLLFYLLHRRAKYRVIEKAIENNYPLPPSPVAELPLTSRHHNAPTLGETMLHNSNHSHSLNSLSHKHKRNHNHSSHPTSKA